MVGKVAGSYHLDRKALLRLDFVNKSKMKILLSELYKQSKVPENAIEAV